MRTISRLYTDIVRGTPLVVQIFIFVYGVQVFLQGQGLNFKWPDPAIPATLACGLNSAAYMGEIIRGGLAAIDKGQREAAMSLGMTSRQSMRLVILPQANRHREKMLAQRVKRINEELQNTDDGLPPTSVSVGIAYGADVPNPDRLMEYADKKEDAKTAE